MNECQGREFQRDNWQYKRTEVISGVVMLTRTTRIRCPHRLLRAEDEGTKPPAPHGAPLEPEIRVLRQGLTVGVRRNTHLLAAKDLKAGACARLTRLLRGLPRPAQGPSSPPSAPAVASGEHGPRSSASESSHGSSCSAISPVRSHAADNPACGLPLAAAMEGAASRDAAAAVSASAGGAAAAAACVDGATAANAPSTAATRAELPL